MPVLVYLNFHQYALVRILINDSITVNTFVKKAIGR